MEKEKLKSTLSFCGEENIQDFTIENFFRPLHVNMFTCVFVNAVFNTLDHFFSAGTNEYSPNPSVQRASM